MKDILEYLYQHRTLTEEDAGQVLTDIAEGKYNQAQIASFLTAFIMRNITLSELKGFRNALLSLCHKVDLSEFDPMDLCGTGGDGKNTFNISTLTSFVVAGAGIPVAKHGNYGVSSVSGSSNVLEQLGIKFPTDESGLREQISQANICFLHAPLFHPAMRHVGPVRKELGVKTFFNMLGPLVNPARPSVQMAGVFDLGLARMYKYLLQDENVKYSIVHALDGFDEVSLTAGCKIIANSGEYNLDAADFGLTKVNYTELHGGDTVGEAAAIFTKILDGKGSQPQNEVVLANAALAIRTYRPETALIDAIEAARESLLGFKAKKAFTTLKQLS